MNRLRTTYLTDWLHPCGTTVDVREIQSRHRVQSAFALCRNVARHHKADLILQLLNSIELRVAHLLKLQHPRLEQKTSRTANKVSQRHGNQQTTKKFTGGKRKSAVLDTD